MSNTQTIIIGVIILAIVAVIWYSVYQKRKVEEQKAKNDAILALSQGANSSYSDFLNRKTFLEQILNSEAAKTFVRFF